MEIVKIERRKRDGLMSVDMQDGSDPVDVKISLIAADLLISGAKGEYCSNNQVYDFRAWRNIMHRLNQYSIPDMAAAFQAGMKYGTSQYLSTSYTEFMDNLYSSK